MRKLSEIVYEGIEENNKYQEIINKVYEECFKEETLLDRKYLHKCNTFKQGIHTRNKRKI
ncbi:MAG: hypothetical protein HFJ52_04500 [Clostridia bacterium]|jgi:hypothetical protein|nr:hypothetical protein [Clostridia bacterium]